MMEYFVAPEDRDEFFRLTRREVVLSVISKEKAHFVNFRTVLEGDEYYQIKFTGDRDTSGNLTGMTLGFHSIDEETRREINLRKKVEKLVEKRTAELRKKNQTLRTINNGIIDTIGALVESRDEESGMHITRVKGYTVILARRVMFEYPEYGLNEHKIALIGSASALHDVGKIAIPDAILRKPGRLTQEEFEIMKTHSAKGCEIIENLTPYWDREYLSVSKEICRHHHEKWDGRGYPDGLKGDEIPISAQIVSVADIFDALTTKRVYKDAYAISTAFDMIMGGECGEFSEKLMKCFAMCREEFELQARSGKLETGRGGELSTVKAFEGLDPAEDEE